MSRGWTRSETPWCWKSTPHDPSKVEILCIIVCKKQQLVSTFQQSLWRKLLFTYNFLIPGPNPKRRRTEKGQGVGECEELRKRGETSGGEGFRWCERFDGPYTDNGRLFEVPDEFIMTAELISSLTHLTSIMNWLSNNKIFSRRNRQRLRSIPSLDSLLTLWNLWPELLINNACRWRKKSRNQFLWSDGSNFCPINLLNLIVRLIFNDSAHFPATLVAIEVSELDMKDVNWTNNVFHYWRNWLKLKKVKNFEIFNCTWANEVVFRTGVLPPKVQRTIRNGPPGFEG